MRGERRVKAEQKSGQSLVEFLCVMLLLSVALVLSSWILDQQWRRLQCAHFVFEATHSYLIGAPPERTPISVMIEELDWGIRGEGICHGLTEKVELPWLEQASWE